jgi:hypothetical protein
MKRTAVEWLFNNLKSHFEHDGDLLETVQMSFQQAKEKEKYQMIDFAENYMMLEIEKYPIKTLEQYYNETFNTNEK